MANTAHDSGMPKKRFKPKSKKVGGVDLVQQDNAHRQFVDPGVSQPMKGSGKAHTPRQAAAAVTKRMRGVGKP